MEAIKLKSTWEVYSNRQLKDVIDTTKVDPEAQLEFGPATSLGTGAKGIIDGYTGHYLPRTFDPSVFEAQVFFAEKKPAPSTVISIIQKREAGGLSYYAVYSAYPVLLVDGQTVDDNRIEGTWTDDEGNQGRFVLVRST